MIENMKVRGMPQLPINCETICARCQYWEEQQLSYKESDFKFAAPLELVYSDILGQIKKSSINEMY